ncbi:hypothetical protein PIB30_031071 [Stylosanthes scabra]|uniref:RNase H type-1 domain-containing protein n=1 Tax=Stylosanthes scabra TaxID=79078 RepID=A0ABU6SBX6_9FABA|nr:hypothetical protein [Stylosanthes scabra]
MDCQLKINLSKGTLSHNGKSRVCFAETKLDRWDKKKQPLKQSISIQGHHVIHGVGFGDYIDAGFVGEAALVGLEGALQFILEEVNLTFEEVMMICDNKEMIGWINGEKKTSWQRRFLRNRILNFTIDFGYFDFEFVFEKDYRVRKQWTEFAHNGREDWCRWFV